jgi:hypothetical protein
MKKWMKAVVAAGMAMVAAGAAQGDVGLGLVGGYWDAGDVADDCVGFGGLALRVEADLLPVFGVEARLGGWGMSDDGEERMGPGQWREWEAEASVVSAEAGLVGKIPLDVVTLFGGGGVGAYFFDGEVKEWTGPHWRERYDLDCDGEVGAYAFGGLEIALAPNVALVGEVRYTWLEVEPDIDDSSRDFFGKADKDTICLDGFGVEIGLMVWL